MTNLLFIFFLVLASTLIWKLRQQSEYAKELITQHCLKLDLQLLSVARSTFNYKFGANFLQASFIFEFSSDNDNNYQGHLFLSGLHRPIFVLPVYRSFEAPGALH
ncbi:DUF3301 domain-containing protein [Psychromonas antarctica]|jgi:hypothetical protein|uniref:DUF3301 domain-containing protein n=1 Tax=Psychromonas antarctica TaxID=67573 RepID=UPI001EE968E2|nr:DUF3301 domain-containing protein [Psychromonas antarctica]MCG6201276.1 DUF3301 domain-containing protein [Psychromonas antarctica]